MSSKTNSGVISSTCLVILHISRMVVVQNSWILGHSHHMWRYVPVEVHPLQYLVMMFLAAESRWVMSSLWCKWALLSWKMFSKTNSGGISSTCLVILHISHMVVVQNSWILGHSHHMWRYVPVEVHPLQHFGEVTGRISANFLGVRYHL